MVEHSGIFAKSGSDKPPPPPPRPPVPLKERPGQAREPAPVRKGFPPPPPKPKKD